MVPHRTAAQMEENVFIFPDEDGVMVILLSGFFAMNALQGEVWALVGLPGNLL